MLRISTLTGPQDITLKLEGKLVREWVAEARWVWRNAPGGKEMVVDLLDVSFVDESGRELLAEMHAAGARLRGSGPMISALIEQIEEKQPASVRSLAPQVLLLLVGFLKTLSFYKFDF